MWHYIIYLALCTAAQAYSVYQPLDCPSDYQDPCGAVQLGCAGARYPPSACLPVPLPLPLPLPAPRPGCLPANSQCNSNLQTILTLLATLKNTGIVGDPIIPTNTTSNCIPLDKLIQLLIISNSTLTFQNLVDLGIIPRDSAPNYLLNLRVANLLEILLLPLNTNTSCPGSSGLLGSLLGGDNSLLNLKLLPALLGKGGLLGGALDGLLGSLLGGGGSGGVVPPVNPPGISKEQFNTLILQLIANLAGGCPPGIVPTLPQCPVPC